MSKRGPLDDVDEEEMEAIVIETRESEDEQPKKKQWRSIKRVLAAGSLLEGVELDGDNVKLLLKEQYKDPVYYVSINQTLYDMHRISKAFQAKFARPKMGNSVPCLKLNPNHGYAEGQSVQEALVSLASSKKPIHVKEALAAGSLLEGVVLDGDNVRLILKEEYNHSDYYVSVNKALYRMYKASPAFQAKFEKPKSGYSKPCLKLKMDHGYVEGQSVQDALIGFASPEEKKLNVKEALAGGVQHALIGFATPKERLNVKEDLAAGSLLEGVELDGESVTLILKEKHNNPADYASINKALYDLYKTSLAFQAKFEQPKQGKHASCLELKLNHDYDDGQSVQDALIGFAASKNIKEALVEGSLLERVELKGDNVNLVLKEKYNNTANYVAINYDFYALHKTSTAFQAKFLQPTLGKGFPCLKLKPNHGYVEGQSVQDALIAFAASELQFNLGLIESELLRLAEMGGEEIEPVLVEAGGSLSRMFLPGFKTASANRAPTSFLNPAGIEQGEKRQNQLER